VGRRKRVERRSTVINSIGPKVIEGLNYFIKIFRENPFDFLSESDIQAAIYSILHEQIKEPFYMKVETLKNRKLIDKDQVLTNLVKTQYPAKKRQEPTEGLFDVAIIHPDSKIPPSQTNEGWWNQKLLGAIEIKYFQGTNKKENVSGLKEDLLKLKNYENDHKDKFKFGLALLFIQFGDININRNLIEKQNMRTEEINDIRDIFGIGGYIISKETVRKVIISEWASSKS
jgi:hypothetical protein